MIDCDEVLKQLQVEDADILREAAYNAGQLGCKQAIPYLASMLKSSNLGLQEAADMALRKIGGAEVFHAAAPLLRSEDPPVRNLAMDILRALGNEDLGSLVELLHDEDKDVRIFASDILGSTRNVAAVGPLCEALLKDPEVNVRYQAAVSLGELAFSEAAKCLGKAMSDEEWVQFSVIEALAKIRDESSVGALVKALDHSTPLVASMIVEALGEIGNIKAASLLLKRLESSPAPLRNKIVEALVKILGAKSLKLLSKSEREKFGEYLLAAITDEDEDIQDAAIEGLASVGGEKASRAILDLAAALDPDSQSERQERALAALAQIGLTPALEQGLREKEEAARIAIKALSRIDDPKVSQLLMDIFWESGRSLQRGIIFALLDVAGSEAIDFFIDVLNRHNDGTTLKAALRYLGLKMRVAEASEKIFSMLTHPYDDVKEAGLDACVDIGGDWMLENFRRLAHSPEPMQRMMAVYALGRIEPAQNLEILQAALEDEVPDVRKVAMEALADIFRQDPTGLALIASRLSDENREVRLSLVEKLGVCEYPEVTPYLLQALDDPDDWVRIRAMEALGTRAEARAVPKLVALLENENKLLVLKAMESLGDIGGKIAFRALLDMLNNEDSEYQAAAEEALSKLQEEESEGA